MLIYLTILLGAAGFTALGALTFWRPNNGFHLFYIIPTLYLAGLMAFIFLWFILVYFFSLAVKKETHKKQSKWAMFWLEQGHDAMLFFARVHVKINGLKKIHVGESQRFLLVCNHRSIYDSMVMTSRLKFMKLAFLTKEGNYQVPFFGRFLYGACYYPVNRDDQLQSLETFKQASELISSGEANVAVFPEGTRQQEKVIGSFHEGVFNIALRAKCPIVVVTVDGGDAVHMNFPFKSSKIIVDILGVLPYEEIEGETAKSISDRIHSIMEDHLDVIHVTRFQEKKRIKKNKK